MISSRTVATKAYLDTAQPKGEPWTAGDADAWLAEETREARALRAAFDAIDL